MSDVLSIAIDVAERRVSKDRLALMVTGGVEDVVQWDFDNSTDVFADPITFTTILMPLPNTPEWMTTVDGNYYRLHKSDYDIASSSSWVEHSVGIDGNIYLLGKGVNDPVTTLASWEKNQPFWLSFFPFGAGDNFPQLKFEFGGLGLEFYSSGQVLVYQSYTLEGSGLLVGDGSIRQLQGAHFGRQITQPDNLQGQPVSVLILPWRNRDLLVLSDRGGGFNFTFDDIEKDATNTTISAAGPVRWQVPAPTQPDVLLAPARFKTSGNVLSYVQPFREPPSSGATPTLTTYHGLPYYDTPPTVTASLKQADGTTNFSADGTAQEAALRVDLAGNGKNTPFLYGASAVFAAETEETDASELFVLDDYTVECKLEVPDAFADERLTLTIRDVPTVSPLVANLTAQSNRPMYALIGTSPLFAGRWGAPTWTDSPADAAQTLKLECLAWSKAFNAIILDPTPFDTLLLEDAIAELLRMAGIQDAEMDIEAFGLTLDSPSQCSNGEWGLMPQAGDTILSWLQRLHKDYTGELAIAACVPTLATASGRQFRFRTPEDLGTTPVATLYATRAEALAAGYSPDDNAANAAQKQVYTSFEQQPTEIESNDIRVTGWDRRISKLFQAHYADAGSLAVTTPPSGRPANWTGEPYRTALFDPAITSQAMANLVVGLLRKRLNTIHYPGSWDSQLIRKADGTPAWRGDVVTLSQHGDYRIKSFSGEFVLENAASVLRNFHYIGEKVLTD